MKVVSGHAASEELIELLYLMKMILTFDGALLMMEEAFWWLRPYRICPLI